MASITPLGGILERLRELANKKQKEKADARPTKPAKPLGKSRRRKGGHNHLH